jgi:hypothetical protein
MSTIRYLLALVIAIVVSLSTPMLIDRGKTPGQRLRDFSISGDGWILILTSGAVLAVAGAVVGSLVDQVDAGVTAGIAIAVTLWIIGLIWANKQRKRTTTRRDR